MLYSVSVITLPSHSEQLEGKPEKLVLPPTPVVANDDSAAILLAGVLNAKALEKIELSRAKVVLQRVG